MDIDVVIEKIANYFGFTTQEVMRKDKLHKVSHARNFIFYILHADCGMSSNAIAKKFNRHKRHIVRQNSATKYRVENFKDYQDTYTQLEAML